MFAIPGGAVAETITLHGPVLNGRIVVDATNNMSGPVPDARAAITAAVPDVRYVRAFNTLGWENFADPLPGAALFFAAEPSRAGDVRAAHPRRGPEPAYVGDEAAPASWTRCYRCGSRSSSERRQPQGRPEHRPVGPNSGEPTG